MLDDVRPDVPVRTPTSRVRKRHEATRAEILAAAWSLVRAHGLAALTLRDVAREVGMRAPSLYSYFPSKNAIYDAMYVQGCREFVEYYEQIPVTDDALTDLRAGMHAFVRFCTDDPARYQLLFQRTLPGFEPTPDSFSWAVRGLDLLRRRLSVHGYDEDVLDLLTAIGTGLADQQISNDPGGDRWIRLIDDAMTMFHNHVSR
ncbi:TetR/AcrR family transcriptional regulator [Rhodococcus sp. NPDC003318]|uniref:TetR/AcrR family transcriptional regulator n=1 Tax=Rhodococcus sp. NPDC003318 TaxID=3364503 RepID=UPI0036B92584